MSRPRRTARSQVGMNLFPFLAVLICTMGSLIVLLVVMVQHARVRAAVPEVDPAPLEEKRASIQQAIARHAEQQEAARQVQEEIEHLQWQASTLQGSYEKTAQDVSDRRLQLSHLEAHTRELSEQAAKLQAEADVIANSSDKTVQQQEQLKRDTDALRDQVEQARNQLLQEQEALKQAPKTYALLPYDGPNGTNRMPIYVECLADRLVMQPEGIVLASGDFSPPMDAANPLAAALRAKREYLLENGILSEDLEPYPLLVVRPHAAAAYAAARAAMRAWDAEFGYELIEGDVELAYPESDPRLASLLQDVVEEAREKRRLTQMIAASQARRSQGRMLRPSANGGFEPVPDPSTGPRQVRGSGFGSGPPDGQFGRPNRFSSSANRPRAVSPGPASHGGSQGFGRDRAPTNAGSVDWARPDNPFSGPALGPDPRRVENFAGGEDSWRTAGQAGDLGGGEEVTNPYASTNQSGQPGSDSAWQGQSGPPGARGQTQAGPMRGKPGAGGPGSQMAGGNGPNSMGAASGGARPQTGSGHATAQPDASSSLAYTRGADWALPSGSQGSVAIKRPIRVVCEPSRLVLVPERGTGDKVKLFRHQGAVGGVVDPFVNSIQQRLKSWGIAGHGIYWQPVLQIDVKQGAEASYEQLDQLLKDSGIKVTRLP